MTQYKVNPLKVAKTTCLEPIAEENSDEDQEMQQTFHLFDLHLANRLSRYNFLSIVGIDATVLLGTIQTSNPVHEIITRPLKNPSDIPEWLQILENYRKSKFTLALPSGTTRFAEA